MCTQRPHNQLAFTAVLAGGWTVLRSFLFCPLRIGSEAVYTQTKRKKSASMYRIYVLELHTGLCIVRNKGPQKVATGQEMATILENFMSIARIIFSKQH
jgi:hypothetical protein